MHRLGELIARQRERLIADAKVRGATNSTRPSP
jgi:hypothetical protein